MTREIKQQFTLRISQANPTEMVVILYDMAMTFLEEAKGSFEAQDMVEYKEAIRKVRGCINELIHSLHMEYEPAFHLLKLYLFCIRRLANAEVRKNPQMLDEIKAVLGKLREAYAHIAPTNPAPAVMSNTQTVVSGMTYGKGAALREDVTAAEMNRGMLV